MERPPYFIETLNLGLESEITVTVPDDLNCVRLTVYDHGDIAIADLYSNEVEMLGLILEMARRELAHSKK